MQAFRPHDANAMASTLLDLAEDKVNELNQRIRGDAIRVAEDEVHRSETRLSDAMVKVTAFRNRELMLDPEKNSICLAELIGQLGSDLAQTQSRASEKESTSPNDPGLRALRAARGGAAKSDSGLSAARSPTIRPGSRTSSPTTSGSRPSRTSQRPR